MKQKVPSKIVFVKLRFESEPRRIPATHAEEKPVLGSLVVYEGEKIVARFNDGVENWWTEDA